MGDTERLLETPAATEAGKAEEARRKKIDPLLKPISESEPGGKSLNYTPEFDKIKEARRQDDTAPKGAWELAETKNADYKSVIKLSEDALIKKSKDLQVAGWLAEAWIYQDGVPGFCAGTQLLHDLVEQFWDHLFPEIEDGDLETRAAPLGWFGSYFDPSKRSSPILALRRLPLSVAKYDFFAYQDSRKIPYESEISGNDTKTKARKAALEDGKISPETFDKSFEETKKEFYKDLERDFKVAQATLQKLDEISRDKFGSSAPSFAPLRKAVEEVSNAVHVLLLKKLEKEPDPVEASAPAETVDGQAGPEAQQTVMVALPTGTQLDLSQFSGGEINSPEQAVLHTVVAAQFLRQRNPANPVPYLLLRALRWGEVRASAELKPNDLQAPAAEVRMTLKAASQAGNWKQVLDVAEAAMSNTCGRAWLDLQRYAIKACDELGYSAVAKAVRSELKSYLLDFPDLPKAVLHDDTGTSNPETLAWLKQEGMIS